MARPLARMVDFIAAEPVRLSAFLRLPLIGLIVVLVSVWEVEHWLPLAYALILSVYSIAALVWVVVVLRGPVPAWAGWASTVTAEAAARLAALGAAAVGGSMPVAFMRAAYAHAIDQGYRFYSYGDSSLLLRAT